MSVASAARTAECLEIDGRQLTRADIAAVATGGIEVRLSDAAIDRMNRAHVSVKATSLHRAVYGRSTGVGANRSVIVDVGNPARGLDLLRSHAVDAGRALDARTVRAMLLIRLSQLAAGSSGISPAIAVALQNSLNSDVLPEVREFGGIGTADLPALAGTALTLLGERAPLGSTTATATLTGWAAGDALPFISSNALTIAQASLAAHDLVTLLRSLTGVSALSFAALSGNLEAFSSEVGVASGVPAVENAAAELLSLLTGHRAAARIQDPYCLRTLPIVLGSVAEELDRLGATLDSLVVAGQENPLVFGSADDQSNGVAHHGLFDMTILARRVDAVQLAIAGASATILRRIGLLCDPVYTGLNRFLAADDTGTSGVMMLEYVAAAASAELRSGSPASQQTAVLSLGAEDDASFASLASARLHSSGQAFAVLVGVELVCVTRALRLQGRRPDDFENHTLRHAFVTAASLPAVVHDRDLRGDVDAAVALVLDPEFLRC